jgi:zinc protease
VYRVQALGGFGGRADQLNAYNTHLGRPDWFDEDLARYLGATQGTVKTAVHEWIDPARAAALSVVPQGRSELALQR